MNTLNSEVSLACHTYFVFLIDMSENLWHISACLAVELYLPFLTTQVCSDRGLNTYHLHRRQTIYHLVTATVQRNYFINWRNGNIGNIYTMIIEICHFAGEIRTFWFILLTLEKTMCNLWHRFSRNMHSKPNLRYDFRFSISEKNI